MKGHFNDGRSMVVIGCLLMCMKIHHVSCEMYHIVPSPSDPCPVESCFTLSQFEINLVDTNTTLFLLPGNHSLDLVFTVSLVDYFAMVALSQEASIVCNKDANFQFTNVSKTVHIRGIHFIDCAANEVDGVEQFSIENCTFTGEGSRGSALDFFYSSASIQRTSFIGNSAASPGHVNSVGLAGGAIKSNHSSLVIDLCLFQSNTAELGGAIFSELHSNITIRNSLFMNNHATTSQQQAISYGGAVYLGTQSYMEVNNSTFTNNQAGYGGAFEAESGSILNITLCNLTHNFAYNGGAVHTRLATLVRVANSILNENHAINNGIGGALNAEQATIHLESCTVSDNIGGAIRVDKVTMVVRDCKLHRNHRQAYEDPGGAICASDTKLSSIHNRFINNSVNLGGGALCCYNCTLEVIANVFEGNFAGYYGGALSLSKSFIVINGSYFSDNVAKDAGGVYVREARMNITYSEFVNNRGGIVYYGGGLYVYNSVSNLMHCRFTGNTGGVISITGDVNLRQTSLCTISESEITGSRTRYDKSAIFVSDAAVEINRVSISNSGDMNSGGALRAIRSAVNMTGCTITNTTAQMGGGISTSEVDLVVTNVTFQYCSAQNTGGIIHSSKSNISLSNVLAKYNHAVLGGIYSSLSTMLIHDTQYHHNTGSIYIHGSTVLFTGDTSFTNCSSEAQNLPVEVGGAVTAFGSIVMFDGTITLANNHAYNGGAIHATESEIRVNNELTVSNNTAERNGGGIYLHWSELNCLANCVCNITENVAPFYGGGVQALASTIAAYSGAVIYVSDNTAAKGGGISLEKNARITITKTAPNFETDGILFFMSNVAAFGGGLYVSDETSTACDTDTECFYQVYAVHDSRSMYLDLLTTIFSENYASEFGHDLFGGLLDRCAVSPYAEVHLKYNLIDQRFFGVNYLLNTSSLDDVDTIASVAVRICFCNNGLMNCTYQPSEIQVKKGETFNVSLVAVDQVNRPVSATIMSTLESTRGSLGEDQTLRLSSEYCRNLEFNVFSPLDSDELDFSILGPCIYSPLTHRSVEIQFLPCTCPDGYRQNDDEKTNCVCEGNLVLAVYM